MDPLPVGDDGLSFTSRDQKHKMHSGRTRGKEKVNTPYSRLRAHLVWKPLVKMSQFSSRAGDSLPARLFLPRPWILTPRRGWSAWLRAQAF